MPHELGFMPDVGAAITDLVALDYADYAFGQALGAWLSDPAPT